MIKVAEEPGGERDKIREWERRKNCWRRNNEVNERKRMKGGSIHSDALLKFYVI